MIIKLCNKLICCSQIFITLINKGFYVIFAGWDINEISLYIH